MWTSATEETDLSPDFRDATNHKSGVTGQNGVPPWSDCVLNPRLCGQYALLNAAGSQVESGIVGVLATPVPLPAAAWLLMSGLGGLAVMARRRESA